MARRIPSGAVGATPADEEQFFHGHPSWRSILDFYLKGLALIVVAGALGGLITRVAGRTVDIPVVVAVVAAGLAVMLALGFLRRLRTTYTITSRRLTIHIGILSRELHECRLERMQNVNATPVDPRAGARDRHRRLRHGRELRVRLQVPRRRGPAADRPHGRPGPPAPPGVPAARRAPGTRGLAMRQRRRRRGRQPRAARSPCRSAPT